MKNLKYIGRTIAGKITTDTETTFNFVTLSQQIENLEPLDYDDGYEMLSHEDKEIYDIENFYKIDNHLIIHAFDISDCFIVYEIIETTINNVSVDNVAFALALRIVDEWEGLDDNKPVLQNALESMLKLNPKICENLWDNGIIEADYFEDLD